MNTLPPSGTIKALQALAESIRTAGSIPSGQLYAACMNFCTLEVYEQLIGILTRAGVVVESPGHILTWSAPDLTQTKTTKGGTL